MYGYGYQYSAIINGGGGNPAAAIFAAYKARVIANGGVVENDACTIAFLESIGVSILDVIFATYKARVETDGGTVTNDACAITFLESIL